MGKKARKRQGRRGGYAAHTRKQHQLVTGKLWLAESSSAHIETPEGNFRLVRGGIREAMGGDTVQALVLKRGKEEPCAVIQAVLERATHSFLGVFHEAGPLGVVVALDRRIHHDFFVLPQDTSVQELQVHEGDVVSCHILEYPARKSAGVVTLERRVGAPDDLDINIETVIASYDLPGPFSEAAEAEAQGIELDVDSALEHDSYRRDLRTQPVVTVDPADARDFDDAVYARPLDDGFELFVHIADVTHYLRWNSELDKEARLRSCSVYLADRVIPMLPAQLSEDVCSLCPYEDRLCMSIAIRLDAQARVKEYELFRSVIRSHARLSYDQVQEYLEGSRQVCELECAEKDAQKIADSLVTLDRIAQLRAHIKEERGALDFVTSETRVLLGKDGEVLDSELRQSTRATALIEEAMLVANECVAQLLDAHKLKAVYRVHEPPQIEDMLSALAIIRGVGLAQGELGDALASGSAQAIQQLLKEVRGSSLEFLVTSLLLRAQRRAIYKERNEGHFALGAKAYCHFTSPIRRYPDVMVHRVVGLLIDKTGHAGTKGATGTNGTVGTSGAQRVEVRKGSRPTWEDGLSEMCVRASKQERIAEAAARKTQQIKLAELFEKRIGQEYEGVIAGVTPQGLYVRLSESGVEGLVPIRSFDGEWLDYDEAHMTLTGAYTAHRYSLGQRVNVRVRAVHPARGHIDFELLA